MEVTEGKEKFVQAWGTLGTQWGINRTMAQVHALLLISKESLCADEIMEDLKISRGNANTNIRALIDWGLVYKKLKPGERKEFFVAEKEKERFETFSEEKKEDIGLFFLMQQADRSAKVDRKDVFKLLDD